MSTLNPLSQAARQAIYSAAAEAKLPAPPEEAVNTVVDKLDPAKPIDGKKLLNMTAFEAEKLEGRTRGALARTQFKDTALANKLAGTHAFVAAHNDNRIQQRLDSAQTAVQAAVSASFGPAAMVAAYWGYLNIRGESVKDLTERLEDLQTGKSSSLLPGNQVQAFHHEQVWPQMLHMLDDATQQAKDGKPTQVVAQYFELSNPEFIGRLAEAAQAGNDVRVNVDPGRLQPFMTKYEIDEIPVKLRSIRQLAQAGAAVSAFPVQKLLDSTEDLMHRKVLRVGDHVLLSGMNANEGSGENIDGGYLMKGPAAHRLGENLERDLKNSAGANFQEVYGDLPVNAKVDGKQPWMGARGLAALFDILSGPSPAGSELPKAQTYAELQAQAAKAGLNIDELVARTPQEIDSHLAAGQALKLTEKAYTLIDKVMRDTVSLCAESGNVERLTTGSPPSDVPAGQTVVGVADLPSEREALLLHGISQAQEFAYVPAYVITRPVAAALIARAQELEKQGKELDVRVVVDAAVFPDGTSPNFLGTEMLEDAGLPVRWITLPRSGDHDRKLHAKLMLTDQAEYFGSTNFSKKGLKENWEESGLVRFDPADPASLELRDKARDRFLRLWDKMSVEVDSRELAAAYARRSGAGDQESLTDALRESAMRDIIVQIEKYERESGQWMTQQARQPEVAQKITELRMTGIDELSAIVLAVEDHLGSEKFFESLSQLGSHQKLVSLAARASGPTKRP